MLRAEVEPAARKTQKSGKDAFSNRGEVERGGGHGGCGFGRENGMLLSAGNAAKHGANSIIWGFGWLPRASRIARNTTVGWTCRKSLVGYPARATRDIPAASGPVVLELRHMQ